MFEGDDIRLVGDAPEMRVVFIPRSNVSIADDSWQVSGFAGTGSYGIVVDELFVPEEWSDLFGSGMPRERHFDSRRIACSLAL